MKQQTELLTFCGEGNICADWSESSLLPFFSWAGICDLLCKSRTGCSGRWSQKRIQGWGICEGRVCVRIFAHLGAGQVGMVVYRKDRADLCQHLSGFQVMLLLWISGGVCSLKLRWHGGGRKIKISMVQHSITAKNGGKVVVKLLEKGGRKSPLGKFWVGASAVLQESPRNLHFPGLYLQGIIGNVRQGAGEVSHIPLCMGCCSCPSLADGCLGGSANIRHWRSVAMGQWSPTHELNP